MHNCSRARSEHQFLDADFSAPYFLLVPPHFVCSGDATDCFTLTKNVHLRKTQVSYNSQLTIPFFKTRKTQRSIKYIGAKTFGTQIQF